MTDFVTRYEGLDRVVHSSTPLFRLSWLITLAMILIEMTPAILKLLTPHADYHHLASAEIRENVARIDEISDRNYRLAIERPESPELSVSEKFAIVRFSDFPQGVAPTASVEAVPQPAPVSVTPGPPAATPINTGRRPAAPRTEFKQTYLDELCDSVLPLFGDIPRPTISIKPDNEFDHANAHCVWAGTPEERCAIEFNEEYLRNASTEELENTMKHELIHAWIHAKGIQETERHGHVFILKGREVGCEVERYEEELKKGGTRPGTAEVG